MAQKQFFRDCGVSLLGRSFSLSERKLFRHVAEGTYLAIDADDWKKTTRPSSPRKWNVIRGSVIRSLMTGGIKGVVPHEKGIQLAGAYIKGDIDLENVKGAAALNLVNCHIEGSLIGANAKLESIDLRGSQVNGVECTGAEISGSVFLNEGFVSKGRTRFLVARISDRFSCSGGVFLNPEGKALDCDGIVIEGNVSLGGLFVSYGEVCFQDAKIKGSFDCRGGYFFEFKLPDVSSISGDKRRAFRGDRVEINGNMDLEEAVFWGGASLVGAGIRGRLNGAAAKFVNLFGKALDCGGISVEGDVSLRYAKVEGAVHFTGATIGSVFNCRSASFIKPKKIEEMPWVKIDGEDYSDQVFFGDVMKIAGNMIFDDAVFLGRVRLIGSDIGGRFRCCGARFENPQRSALSCDRIKVKQSVFLNKGFKADGKVKFFGADIGGRVDCSDATFDIKERTHPQYVDTAEDALDFTGAKIAISLLFVNPKSLQGAKEAGPACPYPRSIIKGSLNLQDAQITLLVDSRYSWPEQEKNALRRVIRLNGLSYERIVDVDGIHHRTRLDWLKQQSERDLKDEFRPQPFEQLIGVLRRMGHKDSAREIGLAEVGFYLRRRFFASVNREPSSPVVLSKKYGEYAAKKFTRAWNQRRVLGTGGLLKTALFLSFGGLLWKMLLRGLRRALCTGVIQVKKTVTENSLRKIALIILGWLWWQALLRCTLCCLRRCSRHFHLATVVMVLVVWGASSVYRDASSQGLFVPTNALVLVNEKLRESCAPGCSLKMEAKPPVDLSDRICFPRWTDGEKCMLRTLFPEYIVFSPLLYSIDVVLPLGVGLSQKESWHLIHKPFTFSIWGIELFTGGEYFVQMLVWFETMCSWFWALSGSTVLVAILKRS